MFLGSFSLLFLFIDFHLTELLFHLNSSHHSFFLVVVSIDLINIFDRFQSRFLLTSLLQTSKDYMGIKMQQSC